MSTRSELVAAIRERCERGSKADRSAILNEFVAITGYHRKHAIRLLTSVGDRRFTPTRRARRRYDAAIREALIVVWEASDRICSKRLKPPVPVLLPALERHGRLAISAESRSSLLAISPARMDRLLSEVRLIARAAEDAAPPSARPCDAPFPFAPSSRTALMLARWRCTSGQRSR
jgi:hypothetical protein